MLKLTFNFLHQELLWLFGMPCIGNPMLVLTCPSTGTAVAVWLVMHGESYVDVDLFPIRNCCGCLACPTWWVPWRRSLSVPTWRCWGWRKAPSPMTVTLGFLVPTVSTRTSSTRPNMLSSTPLMLCTTDLVSACFWDSRLEEKLPPLRYSYAAFFFFSPKDPIFDQSNFDADITVNRSESWLLKL